MKFLNLKNYIPILIVIFFLAVVVLGGLLIWPKFQESGILQNDIKAKKAEIQKAEDYFKKMAQLKNQLEKDYTDELSKVETSLPSDTPMPSLLKFLQDLASQSGLVLKSINPSVADSGQQGIKELKVALDLEGSYTSFKNFIVSLENSSRMIETDNFSFSSGESSKKEEGKKGPSSFNLQIKTFSH